jgi:RimJ/RimL family protein N-acetyltransferase
MLDDFPKEVELKDGELVNLRIITREDEDRLLMFFLTIPESERNFLRFDLTERENLDSWFAGPGWGEVFPVLAEINGRPVAVAVLKGYRTPWFAHIGESWMLVGEHMRSLGLGRILASELFGLAAELGMEKISAEVRADNLGAIKIFKQMGYIHEGILSDYIKDADGTTHDLVIMGCKTRDYWQRLRDNQPQPPITTIP